MSPIRLLACACFLLIQPLAATAPAAAQNPSPAPAASITGLWRATQRFGPDAHGPLIVTRHGSGYVADFAGRRLPLRVEGGALGFDLPDGQGSFRGRFGRGGLFGHWLRPGSPANNGRYGSPVRLLPDGRGRWRGEVRPLEDRFTLFLLARPRDDGSFSVVLRNPERDFGTQLGAERLVVEGETVRLLGRRGGQSEREIASGRFDRESEVITLRFPSRGGSYDFARAGDDSDFYPRGRSPQPYSYFRPPELGDGWRTARLEDAGIDRPGIERFVHTILERQMDSADAPQIHALLIARRGRLVLEEYFHGQSRDRLHDTRSAAKSLTSVLVGAAIAAGAPLRLSTPVYSLMNGGSFPPGIEPRRRQMTLEHLLTMSAGFYCDDTDERAPGNEETMSDQSEEPDFYRYILRVPMATAPGERSVYCSAVSNLALGMVARATGEYPVDLFDRLVARPMAIDRYAFGTDPAGNAYGGGSMQLLPRDFLKFGQLMLDGGRWRGRQILDPDFAAAAVAPHYNLRNIRYGYQWWVEDYPYKDRIVRSFSARGAGGQTVTVVPELELVVATMGGNYSSRTQLTYTAQIVPRSILPAVRERGDDPNAPVAEREFQSRYGRSDDGSRVREGR